MSRTPKLGQAEKRELIDHAATLAAAHNLDAHAALAAAVRVLRPDLAPGTGPVRLAPKVLETMRKLVQDSINRRQAGNRS